MPGPVRDFDFHPDEDKVRVFTAEPGGVLRFSRDLYVCAEPVVAPQVPARR